MRKLDREKIPFLKKRAEKLLERRRRFKASRKNRNTRSLGKRKLKFEEDYVHIKAPERFSLVENYEETLEFIGKIEVNFKKKKRVFIILKDVKYLANESIVVLLSILIKFKSKKIDFNGDFPNDENAKMTLKKSGFISYISSDKNINESKKYSIDRQAIHTHANKKVAQDLSDKMIKQATKFIWREERRCPGLQRVFIELMQNTNNHASSKKGTHHWWVTMNYIKEENKTCFAFIDYGIGIFESLSNKKEGNIFYGFLEKLKIHHKIFPDHTNSDILKLLLKGEIHEVVGKIRKTTTGEYFRGKGLPGIFKAFEDKKISNLVVISNNAIAYCEEDKYLPITNTLSGTFIYWELDKNSITLV